MLGGCFFFLLAFVFVSYYKRQSKWMLSLLYRLLVAHFYWCTGSIDCIRRYVCTPLYNIMRTLIFWPTSVYSDAIKQNGKKEFGHPKEKIKNEEKKIKNRQRWNKTLTLPRTGWSALCYLVGYRNGNAENCCMLRRQRYFCRNHENGARETIDASNMAMAISCQCSADRCVDARELLTHVRTLCPFVVSVPSDILSWVRLRNRHRLEWRWL